MFDGADFIYNGPAIDDFDMIRRLPAVLADLLDERNGFVCFRGGLHVRGAVMSPSWHSLRAAWEGENSLQDLYTAVQPDDIPLGEDCAGDQFLLRGEEVLRLEAETGELRETGLTLPQFLAACDSDPVEFLLMQPLMQLESEGRGLAPGQLVHAYPPFCSKESAAGVSVRAVPAEELLQVHAALAKTIGALENGARVEIRVE